jgi:hypothetical protein
LQSIYLSIELGFPFLIPLSHSYNPLLILKQNQSTDLMEIYIKVLQHQTKTKYCPNGKLWSGRYHQQNYYHYHPLNILGLLHSGRHRKIVLHV